MPLTLPAYDTSDLKGLTFPASTTNLPGAGLLSFYECSQRIAMASDGSSIVVKDSGQAVRMAPADESGTTTGVTFAKAFSAETNQTCYGISWTGGIWTALVCGTRITSGRIVDTAVCIQTSTDGVTWTRGRAVIPQDTSAGLIGTFSATPAHDTNGLLTSIALTFSTGLMRTADGSIVSLSGTSLAVPGGAAGTYTLYASNSGVLSLSSGAVTLGTITVAGDTSGDWTTPEPVYTNAGASARLLSFSSTPTINHSESGSSHDHGSGITGINIGFIVGGGAPTLYFVRTDDFTGLSAPSSITDPLGNATVTLTTDYDVPHGINYRKLVITTSGPSGVTTVYSQQINSDGISDIGLTGFHGFSASQHFGASTPITIASTNTWSSRQIVAFGAGDGGTAIAGIGDGPWKLTTNSDTTGTDMTGVIKTGCGVPAPSYHSSTFGFAPQGMLLDIRFAGPGPAMTQAGTYSIWPNGTTMTGYLCCCSDASGGAYFITTAGNLVHRLSSSDSETTVLSGVIPSGHTILSFGPAVQGPSTTLIVIHGTGGVAGVTVITTAGTPISFDRLTFAWPTDKIAQWQDAATADPSGTFEALNNNWEAAASGE